MRSPALSLSVCLALLAPVAACRGWQNRPAPRVLRISASALGKEGGVLRAQLERFQALHPDIHIEQHPTPDAADLRHQLYVQWLNAGAAQPDVLQLDVIWTPEFAAAGWILSLDRFSPDEGSFFPRTIDANRWNGALFALPWFADAGMLYYRKDLVPHPPRTFDELIAQAARVVREHGIEAGFVWQGARYEGLVTTYLEHLGGTGGRILDANGGVVVDSAQGVAALELMRRELAEGITPQAVLSYHEEEARLAFQNGRAVFMRNWPYAYALVDDPAQSKVAGRVGVAPMPAAPGGRSTAALGGSQLAINAHSRHPELAYELLVYLTAVPQMRERARVAGQYPTRSALYADPQMSDFLRAPAADIRRIVDAAEPRPVTPIYTELSERLQVELHRSLTRQKSAPAALRDAAAGMRDVIADARVGDRTPPRERPPRASALKVFVVAVATIVALVLVTTRRRRPIHVQRSGVEAIEARVAWAFVTPALLCIALIAVFPLLWTLWESLHHHDLRLPWTGRPFVGLTNYARAFADPRFRAALGHTAIFTIGAVTLELTFGLILALALNRAYRGRGLVRASVLIPWAIPTVVAALVWNFMFQPVGITNQLLRSVGVIHEPLVWFNSAVTAWTPVILSDVWKTTPFVALLLLAGLQNMDDSLFEAAGVDGASAWQELWRVTLPLLKPTIAVAVLFRVLDAFRVFDLIYVLTGGGPGTSTEPIAFYTFNTLLQNLRFGYGSALSILIFLGAFSLAIVFIRFVAPVTGAPRARGVAR
jgi:ABC-type sugar transport system permease subunit/ABC-type glycerol-3-phosphate transport system substrate-binding protein